MAYKEPIEVKIRLGADCATPLSGNFQSIVGLPVLLQDIQTLLLTSPGERVNRPSFGCYLFSKLWENIDTAYTEGIASIKSALDTFEPRINVVSVTGTINRNTDLITFQIKFVVKSTNDTINLVIPYRTGTDLSFA